MQGIRGAAFLVAALLLAGCFEAKTEEEPEEVTGAGEEYRVETSTSRQADDVAAEFHVEGRGSGDSRVVAEILGPDGRAVASKEETLGPGDDEKIELSHDFPGDGPSGTYVAVLRVVEGEVEVKESAIEIDRDLV
jgi:hypothetical protein